MIDKPLMLITGSRKGIGKYLAEYYVNKNYNVLVGSPKQTHNTKSHTKNNRNNKIQMSNTIEYKCQIQENTNVKYNEIQRVNTIKYK